MQLYEKVKDVASSLVSFVSRIGRPGWVELIEAWHFFRGTKASMPRPGSAKLLRNHDTFAKYRTLVNHRHYN